MARMQHRFHIPLDDCVRDPTLESIERSWDEVERSLEAVEATIPWSIGNDSERLLLPFDSPAFLAELQSAAIDYFDFIAEHSEWNGAQARFRGEYLAGPLRQLPGIAHWSLEKFLWNGSPQLKSHPLDAFLATRNPKYSPSIIATVLRWKQAKLGLYEIGHPTRFGVALRSWHPLRRATTPWFEARELAVAEAISWRDSRGSILASFVAPSSLPTDLSDVGHPAIGHATIGHAAMTSAAFLMGFTLLVNKLDGPPLLLLENLNHARLGLDIDPWEVSDAARREYQRRWRERDWRTWLRKQVRGPFPVLLTNSGRSAVATFLAWERVSHRETANVEEPYAWVEYQGSPRLVRAAGLVPVDLASTAARGLKEYCVYCRTTDF
ncbi:MAG: hypothetical protein U1A77_11455 [Pirellulales bacterium]